VRNVKSHFLILPLLGYKRFSKDQDKYIHPLLVTICRKFRKEDNDDLTKPSNGINLMSIGRNVSNGKESQNFNNGNYKPRGSSHLVKPSSNGGTHSNGYSNNGFRYD
jgi:hypothetical protein